jgi:hypothetical protein
MNDAIRRQGAAVSSPPESNMTADLCDALRERLAIIRDEESRRDHERHIDRLRAVSEKIDRLQESLPPSIDPRLKHYLERKSYDKALEYLEGTSV